MPKRSDVTDKWHRICTECGNRVGLNVVRSGDCPNCGNDTWTRKRP